uniref:Uncharacterized protein n=1 Tax=Arundo donax TaxID=35708 RepID=A0A0A8ZNP1_ARUDO
MSKFMFVPQLFMFHMFTYSNHSVLCQQITTDRAHMQSHHRCGGARQSS